MPTPLNETPLSSIVALAPVLTGAVELRGSLWTQDPEGHETHLSRYIPTQTGREALLGVLRGTRGAAPKRVHFLTGSYGTGKSYLLLVLASLLGLKLEDDRLETLIQRIKTGEETYGDGLTKEIETARQVEDETTPGYGYLVVVPDYSDRQYDRAILRALREALDGADISYRFPTEFAEAQEILDGWQSRDDVMARLRPLLEADRTSVEQLARELADLDAEALGRFGGYVEAVTGVPYRATRVSLEETFAETSRYLQQDGRYRGIAILFDEFGVFLEEAAKGQQDAAMISSQKFMEFVQSRPKADIVLVLAAHRALTDYGKGDVGQAEMKKMEGRIQQSYRLRNSSEYHEAEAMMGGAFVVPADGDDAAREAARTRLRTVARDEDWVGQASAWYPTESPTWVQQTIIEATYPLHPAATFALPGLSDGVGQNTRTMFSFLSPDGVGGAEAFVGAERVEGKTGRPNLLTLDYLFDYFVAKASAGAAGAGAVLAGYRTARAGLKTKDPLAERVLKTVATITLFGDPRLQATSQTLRFALNLPPDSQTDIDDLLGVLVSQGALRQNQNTRIYSFRGGADGGLAEKVAAKKRALGSLAPDALLSILRRTRRPTQHAPYAYNERVHTNRRVASDYVLAGTEASVIATWRERFEALYSRGDSKGYEGNLVVLYGLYDKESDRARLEASLRSVSAAATFVGAVSATPVPLADMALDLAAATALLDDPKMKANENDYDELVGITEQFQSRLADALDRAVDPGAFSWYAGGEQRHEPNTLSARKLGRVLDEAVEAAFSQTPVIASDVVQEYPAANNAARGKERIQAVDLMLGAVPFSMSGTSAVDAVLKGLLKPNGMFEEQDVIGNKPHGRVVAPEPGVSMSAAWGVLSDSLLAQGSGAKTTLISDALALLYRPPFGLSWPAAEIVLGAFVAVHRDAFELRDANLKQVALSGEALLSAARSTKKYRLTHQAITKAERAVLSDMGEVLARRTVPALATSFGPFADPAARLSDWYKALPELTKKFAPDDDDDVKALFEAVSSYSGKRDDQPARELLLGTLPHAFDSQLAILDDADDLAAFRKRLSAAMKASDVFAERRADAVFNDAAHAAFGRPSGGPREFDEIVRAWSDSLPPAAKQNTYGSPADALLHVATRTGTGDATDRYLTTLAQEWGKVPFRGWRQKKQQAEYVQTFRDAVREVEAWRASPMPTLNRIHKAVFESEAEDEAQIDASFDAWLKGLPPTTYDRLETGAFGPTASALFAAIRGTGTVEERYLGALPAAMPQVMGTWPSWPPVSVNVLVMDVAEAVKAVQAWTPALSTEETAKALTERLGWSPNGTSAAEALDAAAIEWAEGLTSAARRHPFGGLAGEIVRRVRERESLTAGLVSALPTAAGLPPLDEADDAASATRLLDRIEAAIAEVEAWRRPTLDALRLIEWSDEPVREASEFALRLGEWGRGVGPTADDLDGAAADLLRWAAAGSRWQPAFMAFAETCGLPWDVHQWRPANDVAFAEAFACARAEAEAWTPPPVDAETLRLAVSSALRGVLESTGATRADLMAVLFDAAAAVEA